MRFLSVMNFLACIMFVHGWWNKKWNVDYVCEDHAQYYRRDPCIKSAHDCTYYPQECKKTCGICAGDESDACVDTYTECHLEDACERFGNACKKTCPDFCRDSQTVDPACTDEYSGEACSYKGYNPGSDKCKNGRHAGKCMKTCRKC